MVYLLFVAIVQGVTEFLPISSSGHIVLFEKIFGVGDNTVLLSVILHLGTLFSVLWYYRKRLVWLVKKPLSKEMLHLIVATIPASVFVVLFGNFVEKSFGGGFLWLGFLVSAIMLFVANWVLKKRTTSKPFTWKTALTMGLFQAVAVFPGISRSGSTLCAGLFCEADKEEALDFSFLMSVPIIIASTFFEVVKCNFSTLSTNWLQLIFALAVAFICGLFSIKITTNFTKKIKLSVFGFYLLLLSGVCWFVF